MLIATAFAGGYVVALVFGALLVDAQVRSWNDDAMFIGAFAYSFNGTERSLRTLLATKDPAWANESVWWGGIAVDLVFDADRRGLFPSGTALGLTWSNVYCGFDGLRSFLRGLVEAPNGLNYPESVQNVERFAGLYGTLWTELRSVQPSGSDPLTQLGPDRVQSIRGHVGELRTLAIRWLGTGSFC